MPTVAAGASSGGHGPAASFLPPWEFREAQGEPVSHRKVPCLSQMHPQGGWLGTVVTSVSFRSQGWGGQGAGQVPASVLAHLAQHLGCILLG
jgi:hypothetical protein